jgi:hypothetical protein
LYFSNTPFAYLFVLHTHFNGNISRPGGLSTISQTCHAITYLWTHWRRGLRAQTPSIILCVKNGSLRAPQRRGSPHSGEGEKCRLLPFIVERRGYKKIPLVGFQDIYKTDLQNSFRPNRAILRGVAALVTQISGWTLDFSGKKVGENPSFLHFGVRNECPYRD